MNKQLKKNVKINKHDRNQHNYQSNTVKMKLLSQLPTEFPMQAKAEVK